jgi:hypothetical protein
MSLLATIDKHVLASYSMKIVLLVTIVIAIGQSEWLWVIGSVVGIIIGFIPSLIKQNVNVTLPWSIEFLIVGIIALNMGGVLLRAYTTIPWYAGLTQFLISILVAFIAFAIIYILDIYWDGLKMDQSAMAFVVVTTTMAAAVVFEFIKWFRIFGSRSESVEQVLISLLESTIAGIIMAAVGSYLIKQGEFGQYTEGLGKQVDKNIIQRLEK